MKISFFLKKFFYQTINIQNKKKSFDNYIAIKSDSKNWVLNEIAKEYQDLFFKLTQNVSISEKNIFLSKKINLFIMSKYTALDNLKNYNNKIYFPYFHGVSKDEISNFKNIEIIKKNLNRISKIQITNSLVENFFLENKIPRDKFQIIPITIDIKKFENFENLDSKSLKENFGIPLDKFVIGSFQKDGDGWGAGNYPKLIKGPDIFVKTIKILKDLIPELFILLSGPSRGYVKNELKKINVPFKHINFDNYNDALKLYKCINVYVITSREEGGPRAIMESFASKTPLVTTNVGQAIDLVENNFNGFKSEKVNEEYLAELIFSKVYKKVDNLDKILTNGYLTAKKNSYNSQIPLWKNFFNFT